LKGNTDIFVKSLKNQYLKPKQLLSFYELVMAP
jgi:hypothetical protein